MIAELQEEIRTYELRIYEPTRKNFIAVNNRTKKIRQEEISIDKRARKRVTMLSHGPAQKSTQKIRAHACRKKKESICICIACSCESCEMEQSVHWI